MSREDMRRWLQQAGLLPHQIQFIDDVLTASRPARFLLAAPTGLGKSKAIAAAIGALAMDSAFTRSLVIVPAVLQPQWESMLRGFGVEALVVNAQAYRRLELEVPENQNPWSAHPHIVTSVDFLKREERLADALDVPWSVVAIDEVHQCTEASERGAVAKRVWGSDRISLVIAATATPDRPSWLLSDPDSRVVFWSRPLLGEHEYAPAIPVRQVSVHDYRFSDLEARFATSLGEFLRNLKVGKSTELVRAMLFRRWQSSLYAIEQSVRYLAARRMAVAQYDATIEALEQTEFDVVEADDLLLPVWDTDADIGMCHDLLALLEQMPRDSKWAACERLLKTIGACKDRSVILFTDFADTAGYIGNCARSGNWPTVVVTGSLTVEGRTEAVRAARRVPHVLVVTTGASAGLDLAITDQVIHYDIPWDPLEILQRYGRVERLGSEFGTVHHHLLVAEDDVAKSLIDRIQCEAQEIETTFLEHYERTDS